MILDDYLNYLNEIGKHNDTPDSEFNLEQLKKGIRIEFEHTNDENIAKSIAKDHLMEDPLYSDHLEDMEEKYKK